MDSTKKHIVPPFQHEGYEATGNYTDADAADLEILAQLVEFGADLTRPRHTIHYLYFSTETNAYAAAGELEQHSFQVALGQTLHQGSAANIWPVTAEQVAIVSTNSLRDLRVLLEGIAMRYEGEYDGWEASAEDAPVSEGQGTPDI